MEGKPRSQGGPVTGLPVPVADDRPDGYLRDLRVPDSRPGRGRGGTHPRLAAVSVVTWQPAPPKLRCPLRMIFMCS